MGGERAATTICAAAATGSSPHGRGTPATTRRGIIPRRFIPAWAGNAGTYRSLAWARSVHPRMGGERYLPPPRRPRGGGSSPHGRGTPPSSASLSAPPRFIPAWAGNAPRLASRGRGAAVHPRMGGERQPLGGPRPAHLGSSPHGRGTPLQEVEHPAPVRFIPAWAGNASPRRRWRVFRTVHPRMGGERLANITEKNGQTGSSPHGRGTLEARARRGVFHRFIPAWAGNAPARRTLRGVGSVHPRMGGERPLARDAVPVLPGSSPHGRGTRRHERPGRQEVRFIPAWAGNAGAARRASSGEPVHPRMGGERAWMRRVLGA